MVAIGIQHIPTLDIGRVQQQRILYGDIERQLVFIMRGKIVAVITAI